MSNTALDRYAVIGNPIAHSKSPQIHAAFAEETKQHLVYERLLAPLDAFEATVRSFITAGGKGANVTVPFKEEAFQWVLQNLPAHSTHADLTPQAAFAQALNTLRFTPDGRIQGHNTDGIGLVTDITKNLGHALQNKRILLLGAGGAARGVILPLMHEAPAQLIIANRTVDKAQTLAQHFSSQWGETQQKLLGCGFADLAGRTFDIVINATSAGLSDSALDLPSGIFAPGALAYDMVYGRDTPFMQQARAAGAQVADGLGMLVEQAAAAFEFWRGVAPATAPVIAAFRAQ